MHKVSIVIVCMNKLSNLDICLPSIEKFTKTPHKVYVVAYLFSKENLDKLKRSYPWVEVIESNEIRGFSENNNLALRQIDSEFVFIQNDDTEYKEPVLDKLIESLVKTSDATIMSPVLWRGDGSLQFCGRMDYRFSDYVRGKLNLPGRRTSPFINKDGIFRTYNVSGAAFLIRTNDFRNIGFFDERFFFCPEDIVVGETLNKRGQHCYVDAYANIIHYEGVSSKKSRLFYATECARELGIALFHGSSKLKMLAIELITRYKLLQHKLANVLHASDHHKDYIYINQRVLESLKDDKTPKEVFIEEYNKLIAKDQ